MDSYRQAARHELLILIETRLCMLSSGGSGGFHPSMCSNIACASFASIRGGGEAIADAL
jgi:hypothetical protein